ncbi:MAG: IclR family transcriptional regulator [Cupriavidus necator]
MVKSALRVFEILELFESERRPLRVAEMVEKLSMPQSSVSMILKTLVARGYMEFDPDTRRYCPSLRVSFLGDWAASLPGNRQPIHETVRQLAEQTGERVLLGRQIGMFMQYVSVIDARQLARPLLAPGTLRPLHLSAIGIVLLSQLEDERIDRLLRRYNAEYGNETGRANIAATMRAVASARRLGYFESASLATPGSGVIATLLPTRIRTQYLGVGVGGPVARLHARRSDLLSSVMSVGQMR